MSTGLAAEAVRPPSVPPPTSGPPGTTPDQGRPLEPLVAEYSAIYGPSWKPATARKHRDDFARLLLWLAATGRPATTSSLDFLTLAAYVTDLRHRPRIHGVWRGSPDAARRSLAARQQETLSANTVNSYVRPLRSLAIWLVDEGMLASNPLPTLPSAGRPQPPAPGRGHPDQGRHPRGPPRA